jgi:hypothetical protein
LSPDIAGPFDIPGALQYNDLEDEESLGVPLSRTDSLQLIGDLLYEPVVSVVLKGD